LYSPRGLLMGILAVFTLAAILGYGVYGLNPQRIPDSDFARNFFGLSFKFFARAHIVVAAGILAIFLTKKVGGKWIPALVAVALASFLSEHIGTGFGFPFGGYEYTGLLGAKVGGRVPAVIPLSWFLMAFPSWAMANAMFPSPGNTVRRVFFAAYLLTAWDLALDPAMSYLTPYWVWENPGPFYGMPWVNLAGWMGTGVVLMSLLEALKVRAWASELDLTWLVVFYLLILAMPLGMLIAANLWGAVGATVAALGVPFGVWVYVRGPRRKGSGNSSEVRTMVEEPVQ
jgi:putative membrane protein